MNYTFKGKRIDNEQWITGFFVCAFGVYYICTSINKICGKGENISIDGVYYEIEPSTLKYIGD